MTKKHYLMIAAIFKRRMDYTPHPLMQAQLKGISEDLCTIFEADNPKFDEARFMTACGF